MSEDLLKIASYFVAAPVLAHNIVTYCSLHFSPRLVSHQFTANQEFTLFIHFFYKASAADEFRFLIIFQVLHH